MRKLLLVAAILLVPILLFAPVAGMIGDGAKEVTVSVRPRSPLPVRAVLCEVLGTVKEAEQQREFLLPAGDWGGRQRPIRGEYVAPFNGGELRVQVWFTVRSSFFGLVNSYTQQQGLVVVAEYEDGRRVGTAVEIPSPAPELLTVDLP